MGRREVTRRQLLAGIAGAGGIGAAVGTGTAAMVTDEAIFRDSVIQSGTLDLEVSHAGESPTENGEPISIEVDFTNEERTQTDELTVALPGDDDSNNPAYAWVRAVCPDSELAREMTVTISYDDGRADCEIFDGSLSALAKGVPLDAGGVCDRAPGEQRCLQPGEELDLDLTVSTGEFEGTGGAELGFQFVGTQCRATDGSNSPFDVGDCGSGDSEARRTGISFVAFCSSSEGSIAGDAPDNLTVTGRNADDEPVEVSWETDVAVDFVVVKVGTHFTIYDHRSGDRTSGTVASGATGDHVVTVEAPQNNASDPCALAADEFGAGDYEERASLKIEETGGSWEVDQ
jgi:hypothetical protein